MGKKIAQKEVDDLMVESNSGSSCRSLYSSTRGTRQNRVSYGNVAT
jgi:hypothetical protein